MTSDELQKRLREIVARYPSARSAMLPCLHLVQAETGYITPEGIQAVAEAIGVKPDEVESVVTFYSMYTQEPKGRYVIKVCTSISCYLRGCDGVMAYLEERLGIKRGETTSDGRFTLESAECLAACGMAPAVQVNGRFVENVTDSDASALIGYLENDGAVEEIASPWHPISDGRGMATVTAIGAIDAPASPLDLAHDGHARKDKDHTYKAHQNGAETE
jgi:NADH-quinone oxidoreductase E subunit